MGAGHANQVPGRGTVARAALLVGALVGAASACDTVDLGDPPADVNACRPSQRFFVERIWPEFLAQDYGGKRCSDARCHDVSSPRQLRLPPPISAPGLPLPPDWAAVYRSATEQMSCSNPTSSPLVNRPSTASHGGGQLITAGGAETALIQMWVAAPP